jgi:hypothetical protein
MHSRNAVGSPTSASSTALRVKASASPASNAAAAIVVLLRQPIRRPTGFPDRPFSNGRPRTRPGGFGAIPSVIIISLGSTGGPFRSHPRPSYGVPIRQFYDRRPRNKHDHFSRGRSLAGFSLPPGGPPNPTLALAHRPPK